MPPGPTPRLAAPNILLVIADDHRADAIGALGHPAIITPELDRLVQRGTAFTRTHIAGGLMPAVCAPSRACLLTGCLPFRADAAPAVRRDPQFEVQLPPDAPTLPQRFREAGYETFVTGKWHNDEAALLRSFEVGRNIFQGGMCGHTRVPLRNLDEIRRGAPVRIGPGFSTEIFCATAAKFVRKRDRARPFFAYVALTSPHDPCTPPAPYRALYDAASLPLPANFQPLHAFDNGDLQVRDEQLLPRPLKPGRMQEALADYYGMISHHDAQLRHIMTALAETGQIDNTIIVYVSDHGLALGSHGLLGKQNLYEPSVRVPLIFAGPGVPAGVRRESLVYAFDLHATLCELAGLPAVPGVDSRSLRPLFPAEARGRDTVGAAYLDCQRMVTDGRWKLIVYHVAGRERLQLFDLETDPHETRDCAPGEPGRIAELRARLADWQAAAGDRWMSPTPLPPA